ncbi:MAG: transcriptional regulator [Pseudomonas sp.]|jgi:prophage regulatory protein|uniref:helix-turn-helix transcriptional regulator n=1 Tax=Stutzerimonas kunmingensis TaxID=1211807 RepID=UPI000C35FDBA|nr:transcriptional regulator [Stutzerimonas kunmingensis]MAF86715.1 transcriptional regulator [Pseudomonas sp.]MAK87211.1 transcriptional regulator [Pseudomonas sp.]HCH78484.1 transcriptional regulator [Pseudomonas sp.]|tara:strand:- start:702 stop:923 length:222 start_codon:yes stop_codon:yes gene_type:complete
MHPTHSTIDQALIPQTEVCKVIGQTRSGLDKLRKKDPTFPKPIKFGSSRQAAAYYVIAELNAWLAAKIKERDA